MDGLFTLLSLSAVMGTACFLAGLLPLTLSLSPSQLRIIVNVGMGVLVGTSLIVIIPEGVEALYRASEVQSYAQGELQHRSFDMQWPHLGIGPIAQRDASDVDAFLSPGPVIASGSDVPPVTPTKPGVVGIVSKESETAAEGPTEQRHDNSQHAWIGVALVSGFLLMFLIDKLPQYGSTQKPKSRTHHIALNNLGHRFNATGETGRGEDAAESFLGNSELTGANNRSFATTTGLVIHAAADGIALGASSSTSNSGLSLIIFFAIMVHKAPAAFGLTSILLKQGLSKRAARGHLLLFSMAAPTGALLTWILARMLGGARVGSVASTAWWTGMLLLFSGGTFLYVAMHSMQEATTPAHEPQMNGHAGGLLDGRENSSPEERPSITDLMAACFGMILPLFLQVGHAH